MGKISWRVMTNLCVVVLAIGIASYSREAAAYHEVVVDCENIQDNNTCCAALDNAQAGECYRSTDSRCSAGTCQENQHLACAGLVEGAECKVHSTAEGKCYPYVAGESLSCRIGSAAACIGKAEGAPCDAFDKEHMQNCANPSVACGGPFIIEKWEGGTCSGGEYPHCLGAKLVGSHQSTTWKGRTLGTSVQRNLIAIICITLALCLICCCGFSCLAAKLLENEREKQRLSDEE